MSYIQVKLDNTEQGLKFNQLAYIEFYRKVDLSDYEGTFHYAAVWGGLKANAFVKKEEFVKTFEEVCDMVDMMSDEDKLKVMEVFQETAYYKKLVDKGKETESAEVEETTKKKALKNTMKNV